MNFKKWVKSIQTAAYNGARTVYVFWLEYPSKLFCLSDENTTKKFEISIDGSVCIINFDEIPKF
jgi:hypothetical protein